MTDMQTYERLVDLPIANKTGAEPLDAYALAAVWEASSGGNDIPDPGDVAEITHAWATSPEGWASVDISFLARLTDGRWAACTAWCDTTGWDCQAGVDWKVDASRDTVIRFGLDKEARAHLGLSLPGEADGRDGQQRLRGDQGLA